MSIDSKLFIALLLLKILVLAQSEGIDLDSLPAGVNP
jgi:hypothetical protein